MKHTLYQNENQCCGCTACASICPEDAISMVRNEKGFEYPSVDANKCISCNACKGVCDFQRPKGSGNRIMQAYAMQHRDKDIIYNSSSGGAFTAISDWVLKQGGTVYGAIFDKDSFYVKHSCAENKLERNAMRGSKYVQSSIGETFRKIKKDISVGKIVLFSGTPCQCAGLCSYLKGHPENLVIVDLLCHGTPSPQLFVEHIKTIEEKNNKKVVDYHFRSKINGFEKTHEAFFSDGSKICNSSIKRIFKLFVISMSPACFECKYTNKERYGDITIGDMFDASKLVGITDHRGTSTVIVNTELGHSIIDEIYNECILIPIDQNRIKQSALNKQVVKPESYEKFWEEYQQYGFKYILDNYAPHTIKSWGLFTLQRYAKILHVDSLVEKMKR